MKESESRPSTSAGKSRILKLQAHLKRGMPLEEIKDHQRIAKSSRIHAQEPFSADLKIKKIIRGLVTADPKAEKENFEISAQRQTSIIVDRSEAAAKLSLKDTLHPSRNNKQSRNNL